MAADQTQICWFPRRPRTSEDDEVESHARMKTSLEAGGDRGQMLAIIRLTRLELGRSVALECGQPAMSGDVFTFSGVDRAENRWPIDQLRPPVADILRP